MRKNQWNLLTSYSEYSVTNNLYNSDLVTNFPCTPIFACTKRKLCPIPHVLLHARLVRRRRLAFPRQPTIGVTAEKFVVMVRHIRVDAHVGAGGEWANAVVQDFGEAVFDD